MTTGRHPRSDARRRAVDLLYAADLRSVDPLTLLETGSRAMKSSNEIVRGVAEHREEIDALITRYATGWTIERMPVVDRTIMRVCLFEVLHQPGIPVGVAVNEAVELAKLLSTEDSARFVSGLLGRITREHSA